MVVWTFDGMEKRLYTTHEAHLSVHPIGNWHLDVRGTFLAAYHGSFITPLKSGAKISKCRALSVQICVALALRAHARINAS
jgi:hypothetical protein